MKRLLQLHIASECGITIPTTLCSDDPDEIQLFLSQHELSEIICRPLCLPKDQSMKRAPWVLQQRVRKHDYLRVMGYGEYLMAAKLQTRAGEQKGMMSYPLSENLAVKIRLFMHKLGVALGTFDFILTPEHEYIFIGLAT